MTDEQKAKLSVALMGHAVSPETRKKISLINTGRAQSPELRGRKSATLMGHTVSTETRAKISLGNMGNTKWLGSHHSAETIAKITAWNRGKIVSPETRAKMSLAQWKGGQVVASGRRRAKRRGLGFNPLNSWFVGSNRHHINLNDVIYIPESMHDSVRHNVWTGKNMTKINAIAYNFLFKQAVEAAMMGVN